MSVLGTALRLGGKAIVGATTGPVGASIMIGSELLPLISDAFSGPSVDTDKLNKLKQARDGMVARLSQQEGIPPAKALEQINEQMGPLIEQASQPSGGVGTGKVLTDLGSLGLTVALAKGGLGKRTIKGMEGGDPSAMGSVPAQHAPEAALQQEQAMSAEGRATQEANEMADPHPVHGPEGEQADGGQGDQAMSSPLPAPPQPDLQTLLMMSRMGRGSQPAGAPAMVPPQLPGGTGGLDQIAALLMPQALGSVRKGGPPQPPQMNGKPPPTVFGL